MKDKLIKKTAVFSAISAAMYSIGFALAYFKIVSSQIYLTSTFGFRASERPEIYGLIFTAEILIPAIGLFLGYAVLAFLVKKKLLFSATGALLFVTGAYFTSAGIWESSGKKIWETAAMIGVGVFFLGIGIMLFKANSIFSGRK